MGRLVSFSALQQRQTQGKEHNEGKRDEFGGVCCSAADGRQAAYNPHKEKVRAAPIIPAINQAAQQ